MKLGLAAVVISLWCGTVSAQELQFVRQVGSVNGPPEYTFFRISDLAVDTHGRIVVLDGGDKSVIIYDSTGTFVTRFGREGNGPGEFLGPTRVELRQSQIWVFDVQHARLSQFTSQGQLIATRSYPRPAGLDLSEIHEMRDSSLVGISVFRASPGTPEHDPLNRVMRISAEHVDTLLSFEVGVVLWRAPEGLPWGLARKALGTTGAVAVSGDSLIALVDAQKGQLRILTVDREGLHQKAPVPIPFDAHPVDSGTLDQVRQEVRDEMRAGRAPTLSRIDLVPPSLVSDLTGKALWDDNGNVWIETRAELNANSRRWLVTAPNAARRHWVAVPQQFELKAVTGGRAYGVWRDELGVEFVRVYRLR